MPNDSDDYDLFALESRPTSAGLLISGACLPNKTRTHYDVRSICYEWDASERAGLVASGELIGLPVHLEHRFTRDNSVPELIVGRIVGAWLGGDGQVMIEVLVSSRVDEILTMMQTGQLRGFSLSHRWKRDRVYPRDSYVPGQEPTGEPEMTITKTAYEVSLVKNPYREGCFLQTCEVAEITASEETNTVHVTESGIALSSTIGAGSGNLDTESITKTSGRGSSSTTGSHACASMASTGAAQVNTTTAAETPGAGAAAAATPAGIPAGAALSATDAMALISQLQALQAQAAAQSARLDEYTTREAEAARVAAEAAAAADAAAKVEQAALDAQHSQALEALNATLQAEYGPGKEAMIKMEMDRHMELVNAKLGSAGSCRAQNQVLQDSITYASGRVECSREKREADEARHSAAIANLARQTLNLTGGIAMTPAVPAAAQQHKAAGVMRGANHSERLAQASAQYDINGRAGAAATAAQDAAAGSLTQQMYARLQQQNDARMAGAGAASAETMEMDDAPPAPAGVHGIKTKAEFNQWCVSHPTVADRARFYAQTDSRAYEVMASAERGEKISSGPFTPDLAYGGVPLSQHPDPLTRKFWVDSGLAVPLRPDLGGYSKQHSKVWIQESSA